MMQQVATSSSKLAVSSLPVDMSAAQNYGSEAQSQNNEARSAFEQAITDAEQSAFVKAKDLSDLRARFPDEGQQKPLEPVSGNGGRAETPSLEAKLGDHRAKYTENDARQAQPSESEDIQLAKTDEKTSVVSDAVTQADSDNVEVSTSLSPDADTNNQALELEGLKESAVDFDYINFVTQIQSLNQDEVGLSEKISDLIDPEQAQELSNISLTQEELQVILDAKQTGLDLQESLSEEQLTKLGDVIQKMLAQFHGQEQGDAGDSAAVDSNKGLDKELLETLLVSSQPAPAPIESTATDIDFKTLNSEELGTESSDNGAEAVPKQTLTDIEFSAENKPAAFDQAANANPKEYAAVEDKAKTADLSAEAIAQASEQSLSSESALKDGADIKTISEEQSANIINAEISETKPVAPVLKPKETDAADAVKQLALLDERSQTNTLENIKSRVEKFAADLSGNSSKGSEFVAAMQSGLKEFKEQLEAGREPGIDLKALVSDALEQANVDIPAQNKPKIDSVVNQFVGIMSLANAVNQSSQAQSHQLFGLTETQIAKESNVLHAEGTKLAQQAPSNFDKAVNIFKPEGQQQLAEKVRWMVNGRNPAAEIRLDPPELGAMQIKVNMSSETATVSFTVQSAQAKEALDQAVPRLRDMLQEQGIELGQSSVEQQNNGQSQQQEQSGDTANSTSNSRLADSPKEAELEASTVIEQRVAGGSLGGIDFYA
jgi:flagellar hook-length control protein FliK